MTSIVRAGALLHDQMLTLRALGTPVSADTLSAHQHVYGLEGTLVVVMGITQSGGTGTAVATLQTSDDDSSYSNVSGFSCSATANSAACASLVKDLDAASAKKYAKFLIDVTGTCVVDGFCYIFAIPQLSD